MPDSELLFETAGFLNNAHECQEHIFFCLQSICSALRMYKCWKVENNLESVFALEDKTLEIPCLGSIQCFLMKNTNQPSYLPTYINIFISSFLQKE
jgi:hypothetical protein